MKISGSQPHIYLHSTFFCARKSPRGSFHTVRTKESSAERQQSLQKELAKAHAGDQFAQAYSQHEQRNAAGDVIGVGQDKGDDQHIGDNGRDRA